MLISRTVTPVTNAAPVVDVQTMKVLANEDAQSTDFDSRFEILLAGALSACEEFVGTFFSQKEVVDTYTEFENFELLSFPVEATDVVVTYTAVSGGTVTLARGVDYYVTTGEERKRQLRPFEEGWPTLAEDGVVTLSYKTGYTVSTIPYGLKLAVYTHALNSDIDTVGQDIPARVKDMLATYKYYAI